LCLVCPWWECGSSWVGCGVCGARGLRPWLLITKRSQRVVHK
jgi:hypothetical protein